MHFFFSGSISVGSISRQKQTLCCCWTSKFVDGWSEHQNLLMVGVVPLSKGVVSRLMLEFSK